MLTSDETEFLDSDGSESGEDLNPYQEPWAQKDDVGPSHIPHIVQSTQHVKKSRRMPRLPRSASMRDSIATFAMNMLQGTHCSRV